MRRALQLGLVVAFALAFAPAFGQLTVDFCTGPAAPDGKCSDDNLSVRFNASMTNELVLGAFVANMEIDCQLVMDTKSTAVQGWSLAVAHDEMVVSISDADAVLGPPPVPSANINTLGTDASLKFLSPFQQNKVVDGGIISAIVLDLLGNPTFLDVQSNSILNLKYTLLSDVGAAGTQLRYVNKEIGVTGSPPVEINITNNGASLAPRQLTHGEITIMEVCVPTPGQENMETNCTDGVDNDCDDLIDAADPDCPPPSVGCPDGTPANGLYFGAVGGDHAAPGGSVAIVSRNDADLLGFSFGVQTAIAGAAQTWTFSDELGNLDADGNPVLGGSDLNFTTMPDGDAVVPAKGNTASVASGDSINGVVLGAALTAISGDEFFVAEIDPDIGGPGFFVGYVASLMGNIAIVIPTTPSPADDCPSNELVVATVGVITDVPFKRGDANGDAKITVTDGVLILQNAAGNLAPTFDCDAARDANGDGTADIADGVFLLNYIFKKTSPAPPAPFVACATLAGANCVVSNCP